MDSEAGRFTEQPSRTQIPRAIPRRTKQIPSTRRLLAGFGVFKFAFWPVDVTNIQLSVSQITGGIRSLYNPSGVFWFSLISHGSPAPCHGARIEQVSLELRTVVHDFSSTMLHPSAAGLAAFSVPHTSFSFSGIVTRFGPPLDASAARLLVASERMAACKRHLAQEWGA